MSRRLGLIIGVNQYQDSTFQPLQYAQNDARAFAQWLVNTRGGKWSPSDVQQVQGPHATRGMVESLIGQLCLKTAEAGDSVLIYFAGQTFLDERSGEGHLALTDTRYQDPATAINLRAFTQYILLQSRATHILCLFDCAQTGQVWRMRRSSSYDASPLLGPALDTLQQVPDRLVLCSCRANEFAPEAGERNLGLFAHAMIVGMCGPALDSATGTVTFPGLYSYLASALPEQQRPRLFGQQQALLTLVGDLPAVPAAQAALSPVYAAASGVPPTPRFSTGGGVELQTNTQVSSPPQTPWQQDATTTGNVFPAPLAEQRQQQCQQLLAQAQELMQGQNYGDAFRLTEQVLQIAPDDIAALTMQGQLLGTAGRFQETLAVVNRVNQLEPQNALGWSMRAVLLSNMGQHQPALEAIEHSLELDAQNPETYAVKNNIMAGVAMAQSNGERQSSSRLKSVKKVGPQSSPAAFFGGVALQFLGLLLGSAGAALLILTHLPAFVGLLLVSFGLALLCVCSARGAFRYGIASFIVTLLLCLLTGGVLAGIYKFGLARITTELAVHPTRLLPILFAGLWLGVAALLPLIVALVGFIGGLFGRGRGRG